jgi:hypothetical protein
MTFGTRMLGHASAAMTLDTYADLFDDDLDSVAIALDDARSRSVVVNIGFRHKGKAPHSLISRGLRGFSMAVPVGFEL